MNCRPLAACALALVSVLGACRQPEPSLGLRATAVGPSEVRLTWDAQPSGARVSIWRGTHLVDVVSGPARAYTDRLLWAGTTYHWELRTSRGAASEVSATTPHRTGAFRRLYADSSFWNQPVPPDPALDPDSAAVVRAAFADAGAHSHLANDDDWGIPVVTADAASRSYDIACLTYSCDGPVRAQIPWTAQESRGDDGHLVVLGPGDREVDMWRASPDSGMRGWEAGGRFVTTSSGSGQLCRPGDRCNGSVTSGFAQLGGVVRPEEIAQGHIDHALALSVPRTRSGAIACPATHTDATHDARDAVPIGARVQLDPAYDVAAQRWPEWLKVLAVALQRYGGYVVDTGGSLVVRGEATLNRGYDAWRLAGTPVAPRLDDLPWDRLRLLQLQPCG
ncbi:MAG: hypothetical protein ACXVFV_05255 [Mycobacteriales bacterium]